MRKIWLLIWQFPQSIAAFFLKKWLMKKTTVRKQIYRGKALYYWEGSPRFGVSLGESIFIFHYPGEHVRAEAMDHEYGHSRQSRYLGPLYLLTVRVVSVFWNLLARVSKKVSETYYARWPENWADKLGGVRREEGI
jgi:hypothetical protein